MRLAVTVGVLAFTLAVSAASAPTQTLADDSSRRQALAKYRAGQELLSGERWEQAAEAFREAIAYDPLFVDAHYGLGQAYMGARRFASAAQAYTGCLDAARSIHGLRDRNRVAVDRQIDEQVRELRDSARRVASQANPQAVAMKVVQIEQRIEDLERSKSSNSGAFEPPAGVLLALGSAHFRNGNRDEAETQWTQAVRVNGKLGEAWNNLAVIYLQSGRKAMAKDAVTRAARAGFRVNPRLEDDINRMPGS